MSCLSERPRTPLQQHANSLVAVDPAAPMLFPMYTVAAERLLEMTRIDMHEKLKAAGDIIVFDDSMGHAGFVSHQWVAQQHPDPEFKQMQVLRDVLKHLLKSQGAVPPDAITEACVPTAKAVPYKEFQSRSLFLWYDYFSVPQLVRHLGNFTDTENANDKALAIRSIPSYVSKCRFFFALCPTIRDPFADRLLNTMSWTRRGWCRVERASRELSEHDTWILVESSTCLQMVGTALSLFPGEVAQGEFTVDRDRSKLAPVVQEIVRRKLKLSLKSGDFPSYRRHLNLQSVYLRGFDVEPIQEDFGPNVEDDFPADDVVAHFLRQNGLTSVGRRDAAGWCPLHYAALSGKVQVLEGLLRQRADPTRRTSKDEPKLGFAPFVSALDLAVFYKHNDAARLLITARARLQGGFLPAIHYAAMSDNAEGIRLLCEAGSKAMIRNILGPSTLNTAAGYAGLAAIREVVRQAHENLSPFEVSSALDSAMSARGGSAEVVELLLGLRADVNYRADIARDQSKLGQMIVMAKSLQHRFGRATVLSALCYHQQGRTPLMVALQKAQYEGAAALISAGARLDLANSQGWKPVDFVTGQAIPDFLRQGLEGDPKECEAVTEQALYVQI